MDLARRWFFTCKSSYATTLLDKVLRNARGEHYVPAQLHGSVSTLALDFQVYLAQPLSPFVVGVGLPLSSLDECPAQLALMSFQPLLIPTQKLRTIYRVPLLVGVEVVQPQVETHHLAGVLALCPALSVEAELGVVPVRSAHHPHPVDLGAEDKLSGFAVAVQGKGTCLVAAGEGDGHPVR